MMKYNPEYHHRRSIRLQGYDYSQTGIYFVTICTYQRQCVFGEIRNGKMILNQIAKIVAQEWIKSTEIRQEIELDEWIIMPNHLHGIVVINKKDDNYFKDDNNKGASLAPHRAIMLVSAYIVERGLILPPYEVDSKTNGIKALPELIKRLDPQRGCFCFRCD